MLRTATSKDISQVTEIRKKSYMVRGPPLGVGTFCGGMQLSQGELTEK